MLDENDEWIPSNIGTYNENPSTKECRFKCAENYFYDGSGCVSGPCVNEDLCDIEHSTGKCTSLSFEDYSCECKDGYFWNGEACKVSLGRICTGQETCYNNSEEITCPTSASANFYGQDAQYAADVKCFPQSFSYIEIPNTPWTVLDNNTGLMWPRVAETSSEDYPSEAAAASRCSDLTYGGYSDWRLPTLLELLTIVDNSRYNQALNTMAPSINHNNNENPCLWATQPQLMAFYPRTGSIDAGYMGLQHRNCTCLCVRGNTLPSASFTSKQSAADGKFVVTDSVTGLKWQQEYATDKTWQQALKYCENLNYAGYSNWRLPNKNELASLLSYKRGNPSSDFPDMPGESFWTSSTTVCGTTNQAWYVDFGGGYVLFNKGKTNKLNVRCVRSE